MIWNKESAHLIVNNCNETKEALCSPLSNRHCPSSPILQVLPGCRDVNITIVYQGQAHDNNNTTENNSIEIFTLCPFSASMWTSRPDFFFDLQERLFRIPWKVDTRWAGAFYLWRSSHGGTRTGEGCHHNWMLEQRNNNIFNIEMKVVEKFTLSRAFILHSNKARAMKRK